MSMFGQVFVKDNKYKLKGIFIILTPNTPIRNADDDWKLLGITNPRDMTYMHSYGGEAIFFESLSKGKLLATRCDNEDCRHQGNDLSALFGFIARIVSAKIVLST